MPVHVHVSNFQSIRDADVVVDGFTVITGQNNTGKTALMRAIKGVFQNTPGTAFIREGETNCSVTVDFGDRKVTWYKGTGKRDRPTYTIDGGEPMHPGQGVPSEVEALGVMPIQAGGQEVWPTIASQFTGQLFLLDKPGSAVAEAVADVERVGQLNRALSKAESDRRQAATTLRVRQGDLQKLEDLEKGYSGLDEALQGVNDLEASQIQVHRLGRALLSAMELRDRVGRARAAVSFLEPAGGLAVPDPAPLRVMRADLDALRVLQGRLQRAQQTASRFLGVPTLSTVGDETAAQRLLEAVGVLRDFQRRLQAVSARIQAVGLEMEQAEAEMKAASAEADEALKELGCCPVCNTSQVGMPK